MDRLNAVQARTLITKGLTISLASLLATALLISLAFAQQDDQEICMNIVLSLDDSSLMLQDFSMGSGSRLDELKRVATEIVDLANETSVVRIGVVAFGVGARTLVPLTTISGPADKALLIDAINGLSGTGGGTGGSGSDYLEALNREDNVLRFSPVVGSSDKAVDVVIGHGVNTGDSPIVKANQMKFLNSISIFTGGIDLAVHTDTTLDDIASSSLHFPVANATEITATINDLLPGAGRFRRYHTCMDEVIISVPEFEAPFAIVIALGAIGMLLVSRRVLAPRK